MRNEDDRPVHVVHDLSTGATTVTAISDAEWDEIDQRTAQAVAAEQQRLAEEQQLREAVDAHPDPVVQALARRAGLT